MTRRRFIQMGVSSLAGSGAAVPWDLWQRRGSRQALLGVSRTSLKPLHAIPTTCGQCKAGCGIIAYLDGEELVQLLGNPHHPNNKGGICGKGIAGINLVNDPERLLFPLKRKGGRGEGHWIRISWDEAYTRLALRINALISKGKADRLVLDFEQDDGAASSLILLRKLAEAVGPVKVIPRSGLLDSNRRSAFDLTYGTPSLIEDVARSRTILNFGANPYAHHDQFIGIARRLMEARLHKGAKLYTLDVRMSETAAKSDKWIPVKAGTDGIVALAIANILVKKGWIDVPFLNRRVSTPISAISDYLSQFSLEMAQNISGIEAEQIQKLAEEFGTNRPALAILGGGVRDHENGSQNVRCISLLNLLVGNLERPGGLFLPRLIDEKHNFSFLPEDNPAAFEIVRGTYDLDNEDIQIDTYFACMTNPAYTEPDCQRTVQFLKNEEKIPFLAVMDTHLTETAACADLVLPAATYLESWGIGSAPSLDGKPILNLRRPVVSRQSAAQILRSPNFSAGKLLEPSFAPKGEAKDMGDFSLELAQRMGGDISKELDFKDTQDFVAKTTLSLLASDAQHLDRKRFKEQGFLLGQDDSPNRIPSRILKELPKYLPIISHTHVEQKPDQFVLTSFKTSLWSEGTQNSKWVREIAHSNPLWIHKQAADRLGIKNGDKVRVISSAGSLITKALTTSRIHPDSVAMAAGVGHKAVGRVARAQRFKSRDQDTNLIWWNKEGAGVNPNEIIEYRFDPTGGGQAWKDTVVRIEKL